MFNFKNENTETGRYFQQENVIKKLKKETIETVGKVLISFIYNQSD